MAKTLAQVNAAADTFQVWLNLTNNLANTLASEIITANSQSTGAVTTGNAFVNGIFSAVTLTANTLRGGTVDASANLTISSNVSFTGDTFTIKGNQQSSINVQTSGTSSQNVDSFAISDYRTAEYVISLKNNSANGFQTSKLLLIHDDGQSHITEYGVVYTNNQLGVFGSTTNATHCILTITPSVSNTQIKAQRTLIVV